jgi:hypothetical protein
MPERIGKSSLPVDTPGGLMFRERLYVCGPGFGGTIDEATRVINEDFDPRGGHSDLSRARLFAPAGYSVVQEEGRAT